MTSAIRPEWFAAAFQAGCQHPAKQQAGADHGDSAFYLRDSGQLVQAVLRRRQVLLTGPVRPAWKCEITA
jgi:hypothetical protein